MAACAPTSRTSPDSPGEVIALQPLSYSKHIPALDGLRGVAILMVMCVHFLAVCKSEILPFGPDITRLFFKIAGQGSLGVNLFFVLSGFLITGILIDTKDCRNYFFTFYARRVVRIFPVYYLTLFATLFILPRAVAAPFSPSQNMVDNQVYLWCYAINIPPLSYLSFEDGNWSFSHFWSLAVEEHFYLLWPLIVYILPRRLLATSCCVVAVAAMVCRSAFAMLGADGLTILTFTPCRADSLAIGGVVAVLIRGRWGRTMLRVCRGSLGVSVVLLLVLVFIDPANYGIHVMHYTVSAIMFACILVLAIHAPDGSLLSRCLNARGLRFVGQVSYGLYIFHFVCLGLFVRVLPPSSLTLLTGSRIVGIVSFCGIATGLTLAVASLSWFLFESQVLKLKRRFRYQSG